MNRTLKIVVTLEADEVGPPSLSLLLAIYPLFLSSSVVVPSLDGYSSEG